MIFYFGLFVNPSLPNWYFVWIEPWPEIQEFLIFFFIAKFWIIFPKLTILKQWNEGIFIHGIIWHYFRARGSSVFLLCIAVVTRLRPTPISGLYIFFPTIFNLVSALFFFPFPFFFWRALNLILISNFSAQDWIPSRLSVHVNRHKTLNIVWTGANWRENLCEPVWTENMLLWVSPYKKYVNRLT